MSLIEPDRIFPTCGSDDPRPLARIFGVRHLSPAAGHHLEGVLDAVRPTAVLVEGPADATEQIPHLVHKDTRPPLALLAYTQERPVRSIVYPLAAYSPEWVALTWGVRRGAEVRFIDLPAAVFLELHKLTAPPPEGDAEPGEATAPESDPGRPRPRQASEHTRAYLDDPYEAIARLAGEVDHETWWERHFEHTTDPASYIGQIDEFGRGLRSLRELTRTDENLVREAFMRRSVREVLARGHAPGRVLVVCGAFHTPALTDGLAAMTDAELAALPRVATSLTLMPYSYYRLSSQSGYGAGNHAPAYYQLLWDALNEQGVGDLSRRYLAQVARHLRAAGTHRSTAEVIDGVRLAETLSAMKDGLAPTLADLRDAAVALLGQGELATVKESLVSVDVGTAIGQLPKGVSQTSIQADFERELHNLKL